MIASRLRMVASGRGWRLSSRFISRLIVVVVVEPSIIGSIELSAVRAQPIGVVDGTFNRRMRTSESLFAAVVTLTTLNPMSVIEDLTQRGDVWCENIPIETTTTGVVYHNSCIAVASVICTTVGGSTRCRAIWRRTM